MTEERIQCHRSKPGRLQDDSAGHVSLLRDAVTAMHSPRSKMGTTRSGFCSWSAPSLTAPNLESMLDQGGTRRIAGETHLVDALDVASSLRSSRWHWRDRAPVLAATGRRATCQIGAKRTLLGGGCRRRLARGCSALSIHVLLEVLCEFLVLVCELANTFLGHPVVPPDERQLSCSSLVVVRMPQPFPRCVEP